MVHVFFAWRLHIIARKRWLTLSIIGLAFVTCCGGIGTGIGVIFVKKYLLFDKLRTIIFIWLIPGTIADITITVALAVHLRRHKGNFKATDHLVDRIIQRVYPTCLLSYSHAHVFQLPFRMDY